MAFLQSVERHILRNYVFLQAIEEGLPLPIGTQDAALLDPGFTDEDKDTAQTEFFGDGGDENGNNSEGAQKSSCLRSKKDFRRRAEEIYREYQGRLKKRFKWLRSDLFIPELKKHLAQDAEKLIEVLQKNGEWDPNRDTKLQALRDLLTKRHPDQKVLVFSQFADTVRYLEDQLKTRGIQKTAGVWGDTANPTALAWRFSPVGNQKKPQLMKKKNSGFYWPPISSVKAKISRTVPSLSTTTSPGPLSALSNVSAGWTASVNRLPRSFVIPFCRPMGSTESSI